MTCVESQGRWIFIVCPQSARIGSLLPGVCKQYQLALVQCYPKCTRHGRSAVGITVIGILIHISSVDVEPFPMRQIYKWGAVRKNVESLSVKLSNPVLICYMIGVYST